MEARMIGISQAALENRWEEAAKALSSALSELSRERQISLAQFFFYYALEELRNLYNKQEAFLIDFMKVLNKEDEDCPWIVHILDSQDLLKKVQYRSTMKKLEVSAFLAEAVWDAISGVQVKLWSESDPDDFRKWKNNEESRGVYENSKSAEAGRKMWFYVDRVLKAEPPFRNLIEDELYKTRPVVETFERLFG